jgi:ABC-type transport system involved in multi-copper enzyme maturation permease subunit
MLAECASSTASHDCGVVSLFGSPLGDTTLMFNLGIGIATYAVPLVLGVPTVASEIEQRTAMISWPLARSRLKWLASRVGSVLIIGLVLVGLMAAAAEALALANDPGRDLGFASHGARGISLVLRSTLMLTVAIVVGAVVGRLLPALLIGIALAVGISFAVELPLPYGVGSTELTASELSGHPFSTGHAYRAPDGTPISDNDAEVMTMAAYQEYSPELPPDSVLPIDVSYGIAGSRYSEVLARESAVLTGATVLVGGVAAMVVARRRPE